MMTSQCSRALTVIHHILWPLQAILGGTVDVLTLDGMVSMKIPPGTQPDDVLLMRGKGIRVVNSASRR
jgi:DnaJ-class molecular chaperone